MQLDNISGHEIGFFSMDEKVLTVTPFQLKKLCSIRNSVNQNAPAISYTNIQSHFGQIHEGLNNLQKKIKK